MQKPQQNPPVEFLCVPKKVENGCKKDEEMLN